jgi:hypothetical protein
VSGMSPDQIRRALRAQNVPEHLIARSQPSPVVGGIVPRAKAGEPEHDEQVALFLWAEEMESQHPELHWLFAVPNWIGTRTKKHGAYLKAEGRKPGVPDVWLPVARKGYHGLVIEMKVKPNRPSDAQTGWLVWLEAAGYSAHVCYSTEEAQAVILDYLVGPMTPRAA